MHGVERLSPPPSPAQRDPALWDLAQVVEATPGVDTATFLQDCFSRQEEEQTTGDPGRCRRLENPVCFCGGGGEKVLDMSDVRLSSGSPTLERTDTGRVSGHPKPSACRSLFGAPDHDERQRELRGLLREMEEAASAKWDFDFACHTPRPSGRYAWEAVDCRDVPAFYRDKEAVCTAGRNGVDLNGNVNYVAGAPMGGEVAGRSDVAREGREQCPGPRKRPASHDTPAQNKRSHSSTEEVGIPSLSRSAELTPRKKSPRRQT